MFEITLANWPPVSRLLAENVSEWFMLFGVLHKLAIGFAVVSVVSRPVLEAGVVEWSSLVNCALWAEPFVALEGEPKQGKDVTLGCGGSFARFAYWIIGLSRITQSQGTWT